MAIVTALRKPVTADIEEAQRLLHAEADALVHLANTLNGSFSEAISLILSCTGRVIVTGMGKSGHIGAKIAATFASTGTPAFFVHPAEAAHGDLGMITKADIVLAIGHSGESKELATILKYCTRFAIPVIALTGKPESTLAAAATITLLNGVVEEACPIKIAPTTSTTATLALGDALAVALMHRRGFREQDFAQYHPGGKLGAKLLKVEDVMLSVDLPIVKKDSKMDAVVLTMCETNLGSVSVVNANGQLEGVITDGDLKRHMSESIMTKNASDIMSKNPKTIEAGSFATAGVEHMHLGDNKYISALYVIDEDRKPIGLFRLHECMQNGVI